jgi:hypothetical protein
LTNSEDDKDATLTLQFCPDKNNKIKAKDNEYYAVGYDKSCYIGSVEKLNNTTVTMTFLEQRNDRYD